MAPVAESTNVLGRAIALVLGLVFVVSLPLTLLALAWGSVLFSPEQMTDILAGELVVNGTLQQAAVEAFLQRSGPQDPSSEPAGGSLDFLDRQELDRLVETLFPVDWATAQLRSNIEIFYAWIDSDRPQPPFQLDLQPIKDSLQAGGAADLATVIVDSWPVCTPDEVVELQSSGLLISGELPSISCEPPEPLRSLVIRTGTDLLLSRTRTLPSNSPIGGQEQASADPGIAPFKRGLRFLRELSGVGWMLPTSLLGLIVALAVRSWPALLRWWGAPLLGAGLSTFITLVVSRGIADQAQNSESLRSLSGGFFEPILRNVIGRLLDEVGGRMFGLALALALVGLVMLLVGLLLARRARSAS